MKYALAIAAALGALLILFTLRNRGASAADPNANWDGYGFDTFGGAVGAPNTGLDAASDYGRANTAALIAEFNAAISANNAPALASFRERLARIATLTTASAGGVAIGGQTPALVTPAQNTAIIAPGSADDPIVQAAAAANGGVVPDGLFFHNAAPIYAPQPEAAISQPVTATPDAMDFAQRSYTGISEWDSV